MRVTTDGGHAVVLDRGGLPDARVATRRDASPLGDVARVGVLASRGVLAGWLACAVALAGSRDTLEAAPAVELIDSRALVAWADGDLAAGTAPDMYVQKNLKNFFTYQDGGQLLDVSDVAEGLSDDVNGVSAYEVDGATYAIPYRQDAWSGARRELRRPRRA